MLKFNTKQIVLRIDQSFLILLTSFILLNAIIFSLQIIYPAPSWRKICGNNCIDTQNEHNAITSAHIIYRNTIQKIFYILSLLFFAATYLVRKKGFSKYIVLFLGIQAFFFAYFATRGHQWYFAFGTEPPSKITSFFIVIVLAMLGYWLYEFIKKIEINSQNK